MTKDSLKTAKMKNCGKLDTPHRLDKKRICVDCGKDFTTPIFLPSHIRKRINKILDYLDDAEFMHFIGCLGESGYKNHIFFDMIEVKRALSNKKPKCIQCNSSRPITADGLFCKDCVDDIGLDLDYNGKYIIPK